MRWLLVCWFVWAPLVAAASPVTTVEPVPFGHDDPSTIDFGDYTSLTLMVNAWEALEDEEGEAVEAYTTTCINFYSSQATQQQAALSKIVDWRKEGKDAAFANWALNDVATCYFIRGVSRMRQGKHAEAKADFETIIKDFSYALCWDPKGWFWSVAEGAKHRANQL